MSGRREAIRARIKDRAGIDLDLLEFLFKQRFVGPEIPSGPHFESPETTQWFAAKLRRSNRYLEYGSGGSTYLAAKLGVSFITIESDPYFLRGLRKKIQDDGFARDSGQTYRYANIGTTGFWGRPLRPHRASATRQQQFRLYSEPPPECYSSNTLPDFVLIDGRFRVACALKALRMLQETRGWTIAVDDYVGRDFYSVISDFAELDRCIGRMALFCAPKAFHPDDLERVIRQYETEPD